MNTPLEGEQSYESWPSSSSVVVVGVGGGTILAPVSCFSELNVRMHTAGGYSVLGWNHPGFGGSTVSVSPPSPGGWYLLKDHLTWQ